MPRKSTIRVAAPPARLAASLHARTRHLRLDMCAQWAGLYKDDEPMTWITGGHRIPVRRLLWVEALHRQVPPGFYVTTTCRSLGCVATKHLALWPVKRIETRARDEDDPRDTCQRGHDLTDPTVARWSGGQRQCRVCDRERKRAHRPTTTWVHPGHVHGPDGRFPVCRRGHPLAGDNVATEPNGARRCRTCLRERQNAARRRSRTPDSEDSPATAEQPASPQP